MPCPNGLHRRAPEDAPRVPQTIFFRPGFSVQQSFPILANETDDRLNLVDRCCILRPAPVSVDPARSPSSSIERAPSFRFARMRFANKILAVISLGRSFDHAIRRISIGQSNPPTQSETVESHEPDRCRRLDPSAMNKSSQRSAPKTRQKIAKPSRTLIPFGG